MNRATALLPLSAALASVVLTSIALWGEARPDRLSDEEKHTAQAEADAQARFERIAYEASQLAPDHWAGRYYRGDGLGVNVSVAVAPAAGFVFEWHGCLGLYDRNFGSVATTGDELALSPLYENSAQGFQGIAEKLLFVRWGERRYLVPTASVVRFCNAINLGHEPRGSRHGSFLLHEADLTKNPRGLPSLPHEQLRYVLDAPIDAKVTRVGATRTRHGRYIAARTVRIVLDVGSGDGVLPGMEFVFVEEPIGRAVVEHVESDTCTATVSFFEEDPPPQVGWRLSTSLELYRSRDRSWR